MVDDYIEEIELQGRPAVEQLKVKPNGKRDFSAYFNEGRDLESDKDMLGVEILIPLANFASVRVISHRGLKGSPEDTNEVIWSDLAILRDGFLARHSEFLSAK